MVFFTSWAVLLAVFSGAVYISLLVGSRGRDFPDGPPTLPIIGNLHQIPRTGAAYRFTEWAKQYGGMFSLKLGTATAVILTDRRLVKELIDKKSAVYSSRPPMYVNELVTGGDHVLAMNNNSKWRSFRKVLHQHFMETMCERDYVKIQNAEAVQMLRDFVVDPGAHMLHPKRFSNSVIMTILYGIRTKSYETPHFSRVYHILSGFSKIMEAGATPPVDIFPFLKWIPERLFGNWKRKCGSLSGEMNALYGELTSHVLKRREVQGSSGSFIDRLLDQNEKLRFNSHEITFLGGATLEGGSDTSSSVILSFMHAMVRWPEIQKRAHEEIDSVVGEERSPLWEDYAKLPYISSVAKEALRWRTVVPLCFPHTAAEDDWADGKFIPKGSLVMINTWGLHQDPTYFPNPDTFDPDRYAGRTRFAAEDANSPDYRNRDHYAYGAGRRLCPGIHLAERNLFIAIAKLLWAFDFEAGKDFNGNRIEPDVDVMTAYSQGGLVCPNDFACETKIRSDRKWETVQREFQQAQEEVFTKYEDHL